MSWVFLGRGRRPRNAPARGPEGPLDPRASVSFGRYPWSMAGVKVTDPGPRVARDIVDEQLSAFIGTFVTPRRRDRALTFLVTPGRRAQQGLAELQHWLEPSLCRWHTDARGYEHQLRLANANTNAVCVTPLGASHATLDTIDVSRSTHGDSLVLVDPRRLAFFLPHDYGLIACVA